VNFIFLVMGHTKNAADRLFNALKEVYQRDNIRTMEKLYKKLNTSSKVTVYKTDESQFVGWGAFLDLFYRELTGLVKQNHIFSMDAQTCRQENKLLMDIRNSAIPTSTNVRYNMMKQTFYGCKDAAKKFSDAINLHHQIIRSAIHSKLSTFKAPGINPYTQVELHERFGPCLPPR
jgi:hypothetical protein